MRLLKINLLATVEAIKIDEKNIEYQTWVKSFMENTTVIPNIMYNFASKSNRS